ncbi:MAG: alpha/beta hydrolase [Leptospira sp.]|uniref:alpha/beta fold hydrolase n=1 Tax=Leptospira sp. TaxID=178 RepID=UPI0025C3582F|nr:alpha/beta hydrolase [Leptospira sp.]MBL0953520.1 alpha/beta hydrolase [Leptospira sp.]
MEWNYQTIQRDGFDFLIAQNSTKGPNLYWLGSALYYPRVIPEEMASKYQITVVDQRGFAKRIGVTPENESMYNLDVVLDDFYFFQKHLQIPACTILGHSGHGYMALTYAKKYPDCVSKLVMVATGPNHGAPLSERETYFATFASEERKEKHRQLQTNFQNQIESHPEGLSNFFNLYCVSQDALGFYDLKMDSTHLWEGIKTNKLAFDYLFGKVFVEINVETILPNLKHPTKLILGKYDFQVAPYYTWDTIIERFPDVKRSVLDHCGHLPFFEDPNQFMKVMDSE